MGETMFDKEEKMSIDERLTRLENLVFSLINRTDNDKFFQETNDAGIRQTETAHGEAIDENDTAICDVADLSDVNSQAIDDLAEIVDELSNKIAKMEG